MTGLSASRGRPPALLLATGAVLAAAMLLPLAYLAIVVGQSAADALDAVANERTARLTARSIGLALAVSGAAVGIAVPLAWLTARTDLPGARWWAVACALPLVVPSYIGAYAFLSAFGPAGLLSDALSPLGIDRIPDITGFAGAWLVLTLFTYPLVFLPVRAALGGLDARLEEVALGSGRTQWQVFRTVIWPQLIPAVAAGAVLVALYSLQDFGAVSILRFDTFTREIYVAYRSSFDRVGAASLALILVALMAALVWLEGRARGQRALHGVGPGGPAPARIVPLGRWRGLAIGLCGFVCSLALVIPTGVIVYWALQSFAGTTDIGETILAAGNSLLVSGLAAAVATALAIPMAVLSVRHGGRGARALERLSYTGYALPGIVVALALVFFATRAVPAVYQSLGLLVFAFVVLFFPLAGGVAAASLRQISPRIEEAARGLGRTPAQAMRTVTAPLMRRGVLAGAALVFLTAVKELPATLILAPIEFQTLATDVWSATSVGFFERGAIPSLVLLAISAPSLLLVTRER